MTASDPLAELAAATTRFAALVGSGTGQEPVPACEGWVLRDLAEHLGTVHRWAAAIVLSGQRLQQPSPVAGEPVSQWYAGVAEALLAALRAVDPDEPVPNFTRRFETAAFWPRRQLHETVVHGVDAAQALDLDESHWSVEPRLAADGVDEVLRIFFPRMAARGTRPDVRSRVRLVATDTETTWVVGPGEGQSDAPVLLDPAADADAVVTGRASDLYLGLWHRVPRSQLQFEGPDGAALFDGPTTP